MKTKEFVVEGQKFRFKTDEELSNMLGFSSAYVRTSRFRGKSYEEIIAHAIENPKNNVACGICFKNNSELDDKLGKKRGYTSRLRKNGLSYEEIVEKANGKTIYGINFHTDKELAEEIGTSAANICYLKSIGYSYEDIILKALPPEKLVCGIKFRTNKEFAEALGYNYSYVRRLLNSGLSYEEIVHKKKGKCVSGIYFTSDADLSLKLSKPRYYVSRRIKSMSYEQIIAGAKTA